MTVYTERLSPTAGIWLTLLVVPVGAALVLLPLNPRWALSAALMVAVVTAMIAWNSSPVLSVADGQFRAGRAQIDGAYLSGATAVRGPDARQARGIELDRRAFLVLRGWLDGLVRVDLSDPADPTPYWLVSSRRPEQLAAAINSIAAARPPT